MYSHEQRKTILEGIFNDIAKNKLSLSKACDKANLEKSSFYEWIDSDKEFNNQYARATEERQTGLFEEILDIADESERDIITGEDGKEKVDWEVIGRSKLRIDARKWILSKMNPKKYGEKVDLTSDNKPLNNQPDLSKLSKEELSLLAEIERKLRE